VAAKNPSKPTMRALKEPTAFFIQVMGQRDSISDRDGELLRKIYCVDGGCHNVSRC
uniref:Uncharacterized protein n=1 Tax=Plectus sambesii TaxID=2011161 RepID=A0A914V4L3_9BILA